MMLRTGLFLCLASVGCACQKSHAETARPLAAAAVVDTQETKLPEKKKVCEPIDKTAYDIGPLETKVADVPLPAIVDDSSDLAPFYERLARLARGKAKDHVRIAVYGDSNMTMDFITGQMRRLFQAKFGDGGHGYVAMARPWGWYRHWVVEDLHLDGPRARRPLRLRERRDRVEHARRMELGRDLGRHEPDRAEGQLGRCILHETSAGRRVHDQGRRGEGA
jgi:hypothetical protein